MSQRIAPVAEGERLGSVDVLRGVAVLGILAMNITAFAQPFVAYMNPANPGLEPYQGKFAGLNLALWWFAYLLFDQKMMSIFSMLFGAGLILMDQRREASGRRGLLGVYYRRLLWLFLIGMVHAYVFWFGDILVLYAMCGLILYPMRKLRPRTLAVIGALLLLVPVPLNLLMGAGMGDMRQEARAAETAVAEGREPTAQQREVLEQWKEIRKEMDPNPEEVAANVEDYRGPYSRLFRANAQAAFGFQTFFALIWGFWRAAGLMVIGMALMKMGVFSAALPDGVYRRMMMAGYGVGLPLVAAGGALMMLHGFDPVWAFAMDMQFNYIGSVFVALGHVGLIMLLCRRAGGLASHGRGLLARLGAAGRMPLSNYLAQTLICTTIFFGWGFGLFGRFEKWQQWLVVLGVWALILVWSLWWLARFRYGPMEWVWRSLTYWKRQPMRRDVAEA